MLQERSQKFHVVLLCHFVPVLLAASRIQQIRGICIDQYIIVVKLTDHIQSRFVLNLNALQTPGRIQNILRKPVPTANTIAPFPGIYINLEACFLVCFEAMSHLAADSKTVCSVKILCTTVFVCIIKYFRAEPEEAAKSQNLLKGLIALLAGLFCALRSEWFVVTFPVITLIYGLVILITGLGKIQWTVDILRQKKPKWFLCGLSALVSTVCGLVIIAAPFTTTAVLWMFTGISLIVDACFDIPALILTNKKVAPPEEPVVESTEE